MVLALPMCARFRNWRPLGFLPVFLLRIISAMCGRAAWEENPPSPRNCSPPPDNEGGAVCSKYVGWNKIAVHVRVPHAQLFVSPILMTLKKTSSPRTAPVSVVTGAAGFLGSHLADLLLARGHQVIGIDNFVTGTVDNFAHLGGNPNFRFIEQDVTEFLFLEGPVNYVWHFASPASPVDYLELPIQTLKVGSLGTHKALGLAKAKKARFLIASTSETYGDALVHPQPEEYWGNVNTIGPRGCYDEAKRFAEAMTMAYHREHGIETRIVRIFNTYGPRMRLHDGRVVPAFISQALKNKPLTVFGKGTQTRSFCYVSDLVEGIYRLMMSDYPQPVNIGNPSEMTMLECAQTIVRATGSRSKITYRPLPQDDPKQRCPDITKAKRLLKWEPKVSLTDGLAETIKYFRQKI